MKFLDAASFEFRLCLFTDSEVESNVDTDSSSTNPDSSDMDDAEVDPNEPVYCICNKPYNNRSVIVH